MNEEKCPCCPNHCEKDNLGCGRGRNYFNSSKKDVEINSIEEQVMQDLRTCGHILHHNKDIDVSALFKTLSPEELDKLHLMLMKIYDNVK